MPSQAAEPQGHGIRPVGGRDFEEQVLAATEMTVVYFGAGWCAPCRKLTPVFEQLADRFGQFFRFCTVHVDEEDLLASRFRILSIPTLIFFSEGREVDRLTGMPPATALPFGFLRRWLEENTARLLGDSDGARLPATQGLRETLRADAEAWRSQQAANRAE